IAAMRHREPALTIKPVSSAGIIPASTSDDLPQPDGPVTARKRFAANFLNSSSVCSSRPKKMSDSSGRNGLRPGYGSCGFIGRSPSGLNPESAVVRLDRILCGNRPLASPGSTRLNPVFVLEGLETQPGHSVG